MKFKKKLNIIFLIEDFCIIDIVVLAEGEGFEISINSSIFEHLSQNLFEKCKESMKQDLKDENLTINNIDDIVIVDDSSKIPAI